MPSHVRAVAKNDELSLRQFVLEKNVSPVRLPKQTDQWRFLDPLHGTIDKEDFLNLVEIEEIWRVAQ